MPSTATAHRPPMWLALPPGYVATAPLDEAGTEAALARLGEGLSTAGRHVVEEALDVAAQQEQAQRAAHLTFSASGIHPRDDGGVDLSSLVAGLVPVPRGPASAVLLAMARAEQAREDAEKVYVRDYPAGTAVVAERRPVTAGRAAAGLDAEWSVALRSIRVTFVAPGEAHLAVVELTTRSVDAYESYRDVMLELVAPSVTFTDPATREQADREAGERSRRLVERLGGRTAMVEGVE
ncbi:MAG: hypothetical protein ACTHOK_08120 [Nocardioidaceae bacterium]